MRCSCCGRDIDAIGQDNCSCTLGSPLCEDCAGISQQAQYEDDLENAFWKRQEDLYYVEMEKQTNQ